MASCVLQRYEIERGALYVLFARVLGESRTEIRDKKKGKEEKQEKEQTPGEKAGPVRHETKLILRAMLCYDELLLIITCLAKQIITL